MGRHDSITRREAIETTATLAAGVALGACDLGSTARSAEAPKTMKPLQPSTRMPAVFLPHGGGPWPFMDEPVPGRPGAYAKMTAYMKGLGVLPPERPTALLLVSAHWEEPVPTVMSSPKPPMFYDYGGFPPETYRVQWPAPGAPEVAAEIRSLLQRAGHRTGDDPARGFDHGVFVPLALAYPEADVPTLQLSLQRGLDPRTHLAIGRALAPLRERGVFIVGSGMSYHNMQGLMMTMRGGPSPYDESKAFDDWLAASMTLDADGRETRLVEWEKAPAARACHPREEHLLPLHVVAGAAGDDAGSLPYRDRFLGLHISAVHFG